MEARCANPPSCVAWPDHGRPPHLPHRHNGAISSAQIGIAGALPSNAMVCARALAPRAHVARGGLATFSEGVDRTSSACSG
jgi:hypothetical protein